jgi:plasmid stabilization system protein ParE
MVNYEISDISNFYNFSDEGIVKIIRVLHQQMDIESKF